MQDKFEIGLDVIWAIVTGIVGAAVLGWGAISANSARIDNISDTLVQIREDTQYLRGRVDSLADREASDE